MNVLTQSDIRAQYQKIWAEEKQRSDAGLPSLHGSRAEDMVIRPIYLEMLRDLRVPVGNGTGDALDVGSGAGRWICFIGEHVMPRTLTGVDVTQQSVDLLRSRHRSSPTTTIEFHVGDITSPALNLGTQFDFINIANVLFHIPEHDLHFAALTNLRKLVKPNGCVFTTEYLPRTEMRTSWMQVRSRYNFQKLAAAAGFNIAAIRAFTVFNNDPMGMDGPDDGPRAAFFKVRQHFASIDQKVTDPASRAFFDELKADLDRAFLAFCRERVADIELPSQKLVALTPM